MPTASRKLKEARFFLDKLRSALMPAAFHIHNEGHLRLNIRVNAGLTTLLPIEDEEASFYLSAFLNAGRSITFTLQAEDKASYDGVFKDWLSKLTPEQQTLFGQMNDDRVAEVHRSGAKKEVVEKKVIVKNKSVADAVIAWSTWNFSSTNKDVLRSSEEYLELLSDLMSRVESYRSTS